MRDGRQVSIPAFKGTAESAAEGALVTAKGTAAWFRDSREARRKHGAREVSRVGTATRPRSGGRHRCASFRRRMSDERAPLQKTASYEATPEEVGRVLLLYSGG